MTSPNDKRAMDRAALRVGGMVLCGGESIRMGRPKVWLDIDGEPLLARVVRAVVAAVDPVVVVAAFDQDLPPLGPQVRIAHDAAPGRGPLQGLAAGLAALDSVCDAVFVTACDVPWLTPRFVRRMIELLEDYDAAMPVIEGRPYPLSAVYRLSIQDAVGQLLAEDRRSPRLLLERARCRQVVREDLAGADPDLLSLRDLTTPGDHEAAQRSIAE